MSRGTHVPTHRVGFHVVYRALTVSGHAFQQCSTMGPFCNSAEILPISRLVVQPHQHSGRVDRLVLCGLGSSPFARHY